jgi:hypothetical protein
LCLVGKSKVQLSVLKIKEDDKAHVHRLDRSWRPPHQGVDEKKSCVSAQEAWPSFIFKGLKDI